MSVEEDGDEVFTPISYGCQQWTCVRDNGGVSPKLELLSNGYWHCPKCRGSYGDGQLVEIEAKEAP